MTYHQAFDRLGRPVARRSRQPIGHTILQTLGAIGCVVFLGMLAWGR